MLRDRGWQVNHKRVERIWRREGLKVPKKQPKRGRPWLNDGSCIRLRPERPNHVWAYDFVTCRTEDGRAVRLLTVIDEYTRECMAIQAARRIRSDDVMHTLTGLFTSNGVPEHIRSDNGPEFTAKAIRGWLPRVGVRTLFIQLGSRWENGYNESFNGKLRDELLNGEIFYSLREVQILTERWRQEYNTIRPHSSLGYRPPAPGDNKAEAGRRTDVTSGTGNGGRSFWETSMIGIAINRTGPGSFGPDVRPVVGLHSSISPDLYIHTYIPTCGEQLYAPLQAGVASRNPSRSGSNRVALGTGRNLLLTTAQKRQKQTPGKNQT